MLVVKDSRPEESVSHERMGALWRAECGDEVVKLGAPMICKLRDAVVTSRMGGVEGSDEEETETWRMLAESRSLTIVGEDGAGFGNCVSGRTSFCLILSWKRLFLGSVLRTNRVHSTLNSIDCETH